MAPNKWLTNMYEQVLPGTEYVVYSLPLLDCLEETQAIVNKCNNHHRLQHPWPVSRRNPGSPTAQEHNIEGDIPVHYITRNLRGDSITRPLPTIEDDQVLDLVLHNYNAIAQGLDKKEEAEPTERDLYFVKAVHRSTKHEYKKQCRKPKEVKEEPYYYWREHYFGRHTEKKAWVRKLNGAINDNVYNIVNISELTPEESAIFERQVSQWHKLKDRLTKSIKDHGDKLKDVDQIICFGLGSFCYNQPRSFMQHLAALTVRNAIQDLRNDSAQIKILAQDPAYCSNCKDIALEQLEGIEAVTTFKGHRLLSKTTLTISIAPGAPVCQIIADITRKYGGPAAMMCDAFDHDHLKEEKDSKRNFASDESTKNMVDYKKLCDTEDLDDAKDVLGMTYDEFEKEFPRKPAEQLDELIKKGKDVRDLSDWYNNDRVWLERRMINALQARNESSGVEQQSKDELRADLDKNFTKLSDDERKYFGNCYRLYRLHGEVNFPNFALYARKN